jgi:hypothetical protein
VEAGRGWGLLLVLIGALGAPQVAAQEFGAGLGLSAELRRDETTLRYPGTTHELRTTRAGVTLYEHSQPWLQPGLKLGYLWATQSDSPLAAGMDLRGQYVGLAVRSHWFPERPLSLRLSGSFTYLEADDRLEEQTLRLRWYEAELAAGLSVRLQRMELTAGGFWRDVDGDEIARGTVDRTRSFELERSTGLYGEATVWVDPTGSIGLRMEGGAAKAVQLNFMREF